MRLRSASKEVRSSPFLRLNGVYLRSSNWLQSVCPDLQHSVWTDRRKLSACGKIKPAFFGGTRLPVRMFGFGGSDTGGGDERPTTRALKAGVGSRMTFLLTRVDLSLRRHRSCWHVGREFLGHFFCGLVVLDVDWCGDRVAGFELATGRCVEVLPAVTARAAATPVRPPAAA